MSDGSSDDSGRKPSLSVVLATRNGERYIGEQLSALVGQVVPGGFEVVVSDNGSTDDTQAIAKSFADRLDLSVVDSSDRACVAHARNAGVARALGACIVFLDDDDVVDPGYLAAMQTALSEHPAAGARFDIESLNAGWDRNVRDVAQAAELTREPFAFSYGAGLACRREVFDRLGGFDESLHAGDDVDFCARIHKAGFEMGFARDAVLHYRFRETGGELFRQGRAYGRFGVTIETKHPEFAEPQSLGHWLRGTLGAFRLAAFGSTRAQRARGAFYLGRRLGYGEAKARWLLRRRASG